MEGIASRIEMAMEPSKVPATLSGGGIGAGRSVGVGEDRFRRIRANDSSSGVAAEPAVKTTTRVELEGPPEE